MQRSTLIILLSSYIEPDIIELCNLGTLCNITISTNVKQKRNRVSVSLDQRERKMISLNDILLQNASTWHILNENVHLANKKFVSCKQFKIVNNTHVLVFHHYFNRAWNQVNSNLVSEKLFSRERAKKNSNVHEKIRSQSSE